MYIIFLSYYLGAVFLVLSVARMCLVNNFICRIHTNLKPIEFNYKKRLLLISCISELISFVSMCIIFETICPNISSQPILNALNLFFGYNEKGFYEGNVLIIGIIIWSILNFVFTYFVALRNKNHRIRCSERLIVSVISTVANAPYHFFIPVTAVILSISSIMF